MGQNRPVLTDLCSKEYQDVLNSTHRMFNMKWGGGGNRHAQIVMEFANQLEAWSILDYGCGRGSLRTAVPWSVVEYDPGIPGKSFLPEPADLVVCTDVLEHVEPEKVGNVLQHLRSLTLKGAFFVIALSPAHQILTDGRNAHLSLHPPTWWLQELEAAGFEIVKSQLKKGLFIWVIPKRPLLARIFKPLRINK